MGALGHGCRLHPSDPSSDRGRGVPFPPPSSPYRRGRVRSFRCASWFGVVISEPHPLEHGSIGLTSMPGRSREVHKILTDSRDEGGEITNV
jgi:hypothetical protein